MEARFLLDTNICIYIRRKKTGGGAAAVSHAEGGRSGAFGDYVWRIGVWGGEKRAAGGGAGAFTGAGAVLPVMGLRRRQRMLMETIRAELERKDR